MSVEIRGTLDGSCSTYEMMDEEQSEIERSSSPASKKTVTIEHLYPVFIGILVVLNLVLIILVAVVLSRTDADKDFRPPEQLKSRDYGMEQRILNSIQLNGNLTINVTASLEKDVHMMISSFYTLLGWRKSGNLLYKVMTDQVSYATAIARCQSNGGRLAAKIFRDPAAVRQMIKGRIVRSNERGSQFWIGLDDLNAEGVWKWIDGGATNKLTTDWWPGEPSKSSRNEDCGNIFGMTDSKVLTNDAPCAWRFRYMCEVEILDSIA